MFADSLGDHADHVKRQMRQSGNYIPDLYYINVDIVSVQKQPNESDCGVYTSAFASKLVKDRKYEGPSKRQHLRKCIESGEWLLIFQVPRKLNVDINQRRFKSKYDI